MPGSNSVGSNPSLYKPVPSSESAAAGRPTVASVVGLGNSAQTSLKDLQKEFATATGDADAMLWTREGSEDPTIKNQEILIPASPALLGGVWIRFKAALASLPLFNNLTSVRNAREAVSIASSAVPLDGNTPAAQTELGRRVQSAIESSIAADLAGGVYPQHGVRPGIWSAVAEGVRDAVFKEVEGKPLTKRTVEQVLQSALDKVGQLTPSLSKAQAAKQVSLQFVKPQAAEKRAGTAREGGVDDVVLRDLGQLQRAKANPQRPPKSAQFQDYCAELVKQRPVGAPGSHIVVTGQELRDSIRSTMRREGKWPINDDSQLDHAKDLARNELALLDDFGEDFVHLPLPPAERGTPLAAHDTPQKLRTAETPSRPETPSKLATRSEPETPSKPATRSKPETTPLHTALQPFIEGRDERLLQFCARLMKEDLEHLTTYKASDADAPRIAEQARQLHDEVRGSMERFGRWPIANDRRDDAEEHARWVLSMRSTGGDGVDLVQLPLMTAAELGERPVAAHDVPKEQRTAATRSRPATPFKPATRSEPATPFKPATRSKPETTPLRTALQPFIEGRDERLLQFCARLMKEDLEHLKTYKASDADAPRIAEEARQLHDEVRGSMERFGRWPIANDRRDDAEEHARWALSMRSTGDE